MTRPLTLPYILLAKRLFRNSPVDRSRNLYIRRRKEVIGELLHDKKRVVLRQGGGAGERSQEHERNIGY